MLRLEFPPSLKASNGGVGNAGRLGGSVGADNADEKLRRQSKEVAEREK